MVSNKDCTEDVECEVFEEGLEMFSERMHELYDRIDKRIDQIEHSNKSKIQMLEEEKQLLIQELIERNERISDGRIASIKNEFLNKLCENNKEIEEIKSENFRLSNYFNTQFDDLLNIINKTLEKTNVINNNVENMAVWVHRTNNKFNIISRKVFHVKWYGPPSNEVVDKKFEQEKLRLKQIRKDKLGKFFAFKQVFISEDELNKIFEVFEASEVRQLTKDEISKMLKETPLLYGSEGAILAEKIKTAFDLKGGSEKFVDEVFDKKSKSVSQQKIRHSSLMENIRDYESIKKNSLNQDKKLGKPRPAEVLTRNKLLNKEAFKN